MNNEEKGKFLEMVYKVATVDGEYADEEKGIIENYKKEMEVTEIPETDTIDGLVKYFSGKSETIKKIVLFEVVGLIYADDKVESGEEELLSKLVNSFNLDTKIVTRIEGVVEKLKGVYDEIFDVLF